jgi:hypothetical protein
MKALLYLNQCNPLHKNKGWNINTLFEENPTLEQILDHSCLKSSDPNDVKMAKLLIEKELGRFIYPPNDPNETFFELMLMDVQIGEELKLWDMFITGYADMDESLWIEYK